MARPEADIADKVIETWEARKGESSCWVYTWNRREDRYESTRVGGPGSQKLHITRDDRKYNQSLVPEEGIHHDVFTNGTLIFLSCATADENLNTRLHLTDVEFKQMLAIRDEDQFAAAIGNINSELVLRRLLALAEKEGTVMQVEKVKSLIAEQWPTGRPQRLVAEIAAEEARITVGR